MDSQYAIQKGANTQTHSKVITPPSLSITNKIPNNAGRANTKPEVFFYIFYLYLFNYLLVILIALLLLLGSV